MQLSRQANKSCFSDSFQRWIFAWLHTLQHPFSAWAAQRSLKKKKNENTTQTLSVSQRRMSDMPYVPACWIAMGPPTHSLIRELTAPIPPHIHLCCFCIAAPLRPLKMHEDSSAVCWLYGCKQFSELLAVSCT